MRDVAPRAAADAAGAEVVRVPAPSGSRTAKRGRRFPVDWLPVAPFFVYVLIFLLLPSFWLVVGAFQDDNGSFTTANVGTLFQSDTLDSYRTSIEISLATALTGGVFGFFVAYAMVKQSAPRWLRPILSTFAGVAANFAGIPLAFAFAATIGISGVVTAFLKNLGIDIYQSGFTLESKAALVIVYTYFQMPLMLLVVSPALDGLRKEWREAATSLGASPVQFWRWVALPILWPSIMGAVVLLFGSAFAAYATAVALVGSQVNLVPIVIGRILSGDFAADPQMANALALGMIVVIGLVMTLYALLQRRSSRWLP
jgi:putative spermidine/putrescine transport system permease protein